MASPCVSVVVPAYNNWWLTRRCIDELLALVPRSPVAVEIVVVDNASTDETASRLRERTGIRSLRLFPNANFAGAANAGAAAASSEIVLFLNNDAWPLGDALSPLAAAFDDERVVVASGALFYEDGVTQGAGCVLLPNAHWFASCRNLPANLPAVRTSRDAVVVPGAALAVRKSWFLESGGFDEQFRNGFEDADLCMRAYADGRVTRYVAEARFAHYEGATLDRFDFESENERAFYTRWSSTLAAVPRTERGEVGAIVVHRGRSDAAGDAALHDLLAAIRSYGHPVVESIALWKRVDRRFRIAASIAWNCDGAPHAPSVELFMRDGRAMLRTHGEVALEVPWMPCADPARTADALGEPDDPYGYGALVRAYRGLDGDEARADAQRIGAPRRSAMRVIDLARVARFGFEREGRATANAPVKISA